jgi:hypothetical protein
LMCGRIRSARGRLLSKISIEQVEHHVPKGAASRRASCSSAWITPRLLCSLVRQFI